MLPMWEGRRAATFPQFIKTEKRFVLAMMTYKLEHSEIIEQIREDYLHTLAAPMDGMWESAIITPATFWEIQDQEQHAGHFCIGTNHELLRFHLLENYQARAQELFRWIV